MPRRAISVLVLAVLATLSTLPTVACFSRAQGSIGVMLQQEPASGRIIVTEVPDGRAGARAGLEVGDEIVAVGGRAVKEMSRAEFREAVRGDIGSHVTLTVQRNGLFLKIDVERGAFRQSQ